VHFVVGVFLVPTTLNSSQVAGLSTGNGLPNVVVTGIAMTTSVATGADDTWKALLDGQSGIRLLDDPYVEEFNLPVRIGGHLHEDFEADLTRIEKRRLGYVQRMSTVLGRRVWENAGNPEVDTNRLAVSIGTGMGATEALVFAWDDMRERGMAAVSPLAVQMYMPNGPAAAVGLDRHAKAGVITPACRPFDVDRNGFVFGEGGALMVIETEEHAKARGANIIGRLMGASITSDGFHIVAPDPNGERAAHAMTRAVQLAGLTPGDISHVNAHATGTKVGDVAEAAAINRAIGNSAAVYAPKSALGHSVGAAGAVESVLTVMALRDGVVPPTLNLENLDPEVDLDVVSGEPRSGNYEYAISNSFGFGGHNVALAFGKY
jgi:beta-ketoacyl ACP synthase